MKHTLEFETKINCTTEALFRFHADTKNLPLITPSGTSVDIIQLENELKEGNTAVLKIKKGLISFVWELIFEKVEHPNLIVDVATKSPFKSFRHEHHFISIDNAHSKLKDRITFSLPFGILSSPIVWFIKKDMNTMFTFRHQETKRILENSSN